jgi:hypothetical protein
MKTTLVALLVWATALIAAPSPIWADSFTRDLDAYYQQKQLEAERADHQREIDRLRNEVEHERSYRVFEETLRWGRGDFR